MLCGPVCQSLQIYFVHLNEFRAKKHIQLMKSIPEIKNNVTIKERLTQNRSMGNEVLSSYKEGRGGNQGESAKYAPTELVKIEPVL